MAQVTVELGQLLTRTNFQLFDFDYTFDDLDMKARLEQAVIDYYFDYEIGFETPDLFKRKFKRQWLQTVSYYNELHNTTLLSYNPLLNSSMTEALEQLTTRLNTQDATSSSNSNGTTEMNGTTDVNNTTTDNSSSVTDQSGTNSNTRTDNLTGTSDTNQKSSDYPQQPIAGGDFLNGEQDITSTTTNTGTVIDSGSTTSDSTTTNTGTTSNVGNSTSDSTTTNTDTSSTNSLVTDNGTDNTAYTKTIEGMTGTTYQELIKKERENIIRITGMVINELKPCFILVY